MGSSLFVTIAVMTVIVAITAGVFARSRNIRSILGGVGWALLPLSLYLTGLTTLLVNGFASLTAWVTRTEWSDTMTWGAGLGALGIVLIGVASFMSAKRPSAVEKASRKKAAAKQDRSAVARRQQTTEPQPAPKKAPTSSKSEPVDEDLDEIEAILKRRGIN